MEQTKVRESGPIIVCDNLVKIYKTKDLEVVALQGLDLEVQRGELMAIIGNSGSGKSTLLNMLGALDKPSAGLLEVDGQNLLKFNEKQIFRYKRETVGFVWQNNARNLIPYLNAVENVEVPMIVDAAKEKRERAEALIEMVGLSHRRKNKLRELSGGEQQRVAIAIALANNPKILLADEPTGAVDTRTANRLLELMRELNDKLGITVIIVTHDRHLSSMVDRVVNIRDGRTSSEFIRRSYASDLKELSRNLPHEEVPEDKTHEEFVVLDRIGRMQIPKDFMDANNLKPNARLRFEYENDRLILSPMEVATPAEVAARDANTGDETGLPSVEEDTRASVEENVETQDKTSRKRLFWHEKPEK
ncbi:MAG: ATP-binding cassette domain-containing protein [Clostridiaceae bacterium]|nr:ATP-binding cassette domain-containing protein [Clostridiaceae bacterium]